MHVLWHVSALLTYYLQLNAKLEVVEFKCMGTLKKTYSKENSSLVMICMKKRKQSIIIFPCQSVINSWNKIRKKDIFSSIENQTGLHVIYCWISLFCISKMRFYIYTVKTNISYFFVSTSVPNIFRSRESIYLYKNIY